jgi:23S rRNA pseudouridine2604 synthase
MGSDKAENDNTELVRLSKLMGERGLCSRREADEYIQNGWVKVDGQIVNTLGTKVTRKVTIQLLREAQVLQSSQVTVILNKPIGYVSAQPEKGYIPAIQLLTSDRMYKINSEENSLLKFSPRDLDHLAVVGRLDIDSQGLLLFTQDGRLAKKIIGQDSETEKEYLVRVKGTLSSEQLNLLNFGLSLDDEKLKPAHVEWINNDQLRFVLKQGKKRQVRRMCELVGLEVVGLKRVRIGNLMLSDLPEGQWRFLSHDEVSKISF